MLKGIKYVRSVNGFLLLFLYVILSSCGGSRSAAKEEQMQVQYQKVKSLINSREYRFIASAAFPLQTNAVMDATQNIFRGTENSGTRIVLTNNDAYVNVISDSIVGQLAYFGEMRTANYSDDRDTAIIFNSSPQSYETAVNDKKKKVEVKFTIKTGTEQFNVKMDVFHNKRVVLFVYGANRTAIRYEGSIMEPIN